MKKVLCIISVIAFASASFAESSEYRLNGKSYPLEIAPPYKQLPSLNDTRKELLKTPENGDVLEYKQDGIIITGRVNKAFHILCSNGMEMELKNETIQQLFQMIAETQIMLNTPQQKPDSGEHIEHIESDIIINSRFEVFDSSLIGEERISPSIFDSEIQMIDE